MYRTGVLRGRTGWLLPGVVVALLAALLVAEPVLVEPALAESAAGRDFDALAATGNEDARGLWSDGTTMWVSDATDAKIYAYDMTTRARDAAKDISLHADNDAPHGIWSDGTTLYVVQGGGEVGETLKIFAYQWSDKSRDASKDIDLWPYYRYRNNNPGGLWGDDVHNGEDLFFVAEAGLGRGFRAYIVAYHQITGLSGPEFSQPDVSHDRGSRSPSGVWANSDTMWVTDHNSKTVHAYMRSTSVYLPRLNFTINNASSLTDMWSNGTTAWVLSNADDKIYSAVLPVAPAEPAMFTAVSGLRSVALSWVAVPAADVGSSAVASYEVRYRRAVDSVWIDVTRSSAAAVVETISGLTNDVPYEFQVKAVNSEAVSDWVAVEGVPGDVPPAGSPSAPQMLSVSPVEGGFDVTWQAPDVLGTSAVTGYEIQYREAQFTRRGEYSDVVAVSGATTLSYELRSLLALARYDIKVRAVNDAGSGEWARVASGGIDFTADGIGELRGVWSDATTMYLAGNAVIRAYDIHTGARDSAKDFALPGVTAMGGIWSDGTTMWVTDGVSRKILAYSMSTRQRDTDKDFVDVVPANRRSFLRDTWSDGATMWVTDWWNDVAHAYDLNRRVRRPDQDFVLPESSGPSGVWSDGTTMWIYYAAARRLWAYDLATKQRDTALDVRNPLADRYITGIIWAAGGTAWLVNGESLVAFRLPSRPESPSSLSVASGNAQLTLSWPASSTAGATYEVQKRDDGAAGVWSAVTRSDPAAVTETVTGLANGTFYELRARSVGGDLLTSAWVEASGTPVLAGAPGAPGGLEVGGDLETYEEVGPDRGAGRPGAGGEVGCSDGDGDFI